MTQECTLVGGPLDGETVEMEPRVNELVVPTMTRFRTIVVDGKPKRLIGQFTYKRRDARHFDYAG